MLSCFRKCKLYTLLYIVGTVLRPNSDWWSTQLYITLFWLCCMHFRYTGSVIGTQYGPGTGPILLDNVNCVGNETSIANCPHAGWNVSNCDHSEDVSVLCGVSPVQYGNWHYVHHYCTWTPYSIAQPRCRYIAFLSVPLTHSGIALKRLNWPSCSQRRMV